MNHFLVFGARKWQNVMGNKGLTWEIVGVFEADHPDKACVIAAQKHGVGTCFAIDGYAWGVDTVQVQNVNELGVDADPLARVERMAQALTERLAASLPAPPVHELEEGDVSDGE